MARKAMEPPSEEKEQGQAQVDEALEKQTEEIPPTEATVMETVAQMAPVVEPAQQAAPEQQKPNMWRIPANYEGIMGGAQKSTMQQQEDVGYLWAALAADPRVHPTIRLIAESLLTGRSTRGPAR